MSDAQRVQKPGSDVQRAKGVHVLEGGMPEGAEAAAGPKSSGVQSSLSQAAGPKSSGALSSSSQAVGIKAAGAAEAAEGVASGR